MSSSSPKGRQLADLKYYESIYSMGYGQWEIRVWVKQLECLDEYDHNYIRRAVDAMGPWTSQAALAKMIVCLADVNCVEVIHKKTRSGPIIHSTWP